MCYWGKTEFRGLLEYGCYKDCAGLERTAKHAGDYKGLRGILKICGLHVTMGHYDPDCREHGGNEGLQGTMAAYGGPAGSDPRGLRGILLFLPLAGLQSKVPANCERQI